MGRKPPAAGPATSVPSTLRGKFSKNIPHIYQNIYQDISKYIQDIQRYTSISKIPSGGGAAPPGPAPRRPGPDRGPRLGAGPGRAAPPPLGILYILVYLCISWIYLDIFGYIFVYSKVELSGPITPTF